jgi:hypothetical protein
MKYELKELVCLAKNNQAFHVLLDGVPVGILTDEYHYSGGSYTHKNWRIFGINNFKQCQNWSLNDYFSIPELEVKIQEIDPAVFDPENKNFYIEYITAYGNRAYYGIDKSTSYPTIKKRVNQAELFTEEDAVKLADQDVLNSSFSVSGDRIVSVNVIKQGSSSEIVHERIIEANPVIYK